MRKIYLVLIMVVVTGLLIGCPSDPTGNGGGTTNPEKPVEQKPHIDYPDWNNNRVDDREETLTPKDRAELFSILDYQKKYEDKGWLAKSIDVNNLGLIDDSTQMTAPVNVQNPPSFPRSFLFQRGDLYIRWFSQDVSNWDVSQLTNLSGLFFFAEDFNQDISSWDVSSVTEMEGLFAYTSFSQDIGSWNVENVSNMKGLFLASDFNQDISNWDVSNVTNMSYMLSSELFNQDISKWDVSSVTDMSYMFTASPFDHSLSTWVDRIEKVEDFTYMFAWSQMNQDLRSWDVTGKITDEMFYGTPMEFKKDQHPQGCLCGARWDDPRNTEYRDTYGEWSHDPDNPIIN